MFAEGAASADEEDVAEGGGHGDAGGGLGG